MRTTITIGWDASNLRHKGLLTTLNRIVNVYLLAEVRLIERYSGACWCEAASV